MIYIAVLLLLVSLTLRYDINEKTKYRDHCYYIMLIIFILVAGLRWRLMVDTPTYIYNFYHEYPTLDKFSFRDYPIGEDPFYVLINSIVKSLVGRFYWVQLIEATFVNVLVFKYIKRHSAYIFTCLFFYAITCYTGYSMETMRASFSLVICLFAYDYILEKKWIKGYLLLFIALMFHAQTIVMFILPLFFFLRLNKIGVVFFIGAFLLGIVLQHILEEYIALMEMSGEIGDKVENYVESDKYGTQGGNINFYIVRIFPYLAYPILSLLYMKKTAPDHELLKLEPFVMLGLSFMVMRMNFEIAYRYIDYFLIHFVLYFAFSFVKIAQNVLRVKKGVAYMRAVIVFIPFFLLIGYSRYLRLYTLVPYSSVFERNIDHNREIEYSKTKKFTPPPNVWEY